MYSKRIQNGQIALIVLLMMTVLLTIGLSVAQESSRQLRTATLEQESSQVLNAAEAAIERALSQELQPGQFTLAEDTFENITVTYEILELDRLDTRLAEGTTIEIDTNGVPNGHNLIIDWSRENGCAENPASLIISTYFDDAGTTRVDYEPIAACDTGDDFTVASNQQNDQYNYRYTHPLEENDQFVRIQAVYNDTHIRVFDSGTAYDLPEQFYKIRAEAVRNGSGETRIVEVTRSKPALSSIFDFAVYSGTDIIR